MQTYARAGDAARRAVAIDDGDANAHSALWQCTICSRADTRKPGAGCGALSTSTPTRPSLTAISVCSYAFAGDYETALPILDQAIRLSPRDPLLVIWHLCKGWAALLSERYGEAVEFTTQAVDANPEFPDNHAVLAAAHGHLGKLAAAGRGIRRVSAAHAGLTAADERLNRPVWRAEQRQRFLDGLRKAGLPEE